MAKNNSSIGDGSAGQLEEKPYREIEIGGIWGKLCGEIRQRESLQKKKTSWAKMKMGETSRDFVGGDFAGKTAI